MATLRPPDNGAVGDRPSAAPFRLAGPAKVVDLMEILKQSLNETKKTKATRASAPGMKPASIVACVYVFGLVGLLIAPETRGKPLPE